jgi:hypothetical protein
MLRVVQAFIVSVRWGAVRPERREEQIEMMRMFVSDSLQGLAPCFGVLGSALQAVRRAQVEAAEGKVPHVITIHSRQSNGKMATSYRPSPMLTASKKRGRRQESSLLPLQCQESLQSEFGTNGGDSLHTADSSHQASPPFRNS